MKNETCPVCKTCHTGDCIETGPAYMGIWDRAMAPADVLPTRRVAHVTDAELARGAWRRLESV